MWLGPAQQSALSHLRNGPTFRILAGPTGSGRTTLLDQLIRELGDTASVLRHAPAERAAAPLLPSLLSDVGVDSRTTAVEEQRELLDLLIEQRRRRGLRVIVIVDDAERLDAQEVAELDRLVVGRFAGGPALELVLTALVDSAEGALRELESTTPASAIAEIGWLDADEAQQYIEWRLRAYGLNGLISQTASHLIARCAGGRFQAIDLLCQMALLEMRQRGCNRVDVTVVDQAARTLARRRAMIDSEPEQPPPSTTHLELPGDALIVTCDGAVVSCHALRDRMLIGRAVGNDVRLRHGHVSRHHAILMRTGDGYYVTDLSSENGVALNGRAVTGAALSDQDVLKIGPYRLKLELGPDRDRLETDVVTDPLDDTIVLDEQLAPPRVPLRVVK